MPFSTSRSETRGRPVRPCTAGCCGGINGSNSAHSSSLISRGGEEDAGEDMLRTLRRTVGTEQSPTTYFCNVFLGVPGTRDKPRRTLQRHSEGLATYPARTEIRSLPDRHSRLPIRYVMPKCAVTTTELASATRQAGSGTSTVR